MHWSRVSAQLSGDNERDLFPDPWPRAGGFEFDHLPRVRLHLHAAGERIHRHHGGQDRPLACPEVLLAPAAPPDYLDIDQRLGGDVHLDDLAILVRDAPGVCDAFDMHHSGAQRVGKGLGETSMVTAKTMPSRRSVPGEDWRCTALLLFCDLDPNMDTTPVAGKIPWG